MHTKQSTAIKPFDKILIEGYIYTVKHITRGYVWIDDGQDGGTLEKNGVWIDTFSDTFTFSKRDEIDIVPS